MQSGDGVASGASGFGSALMAATADVVTLGPFELLFRPDGDDPGTGSVAIRTGFGLEGATPVGVSRAEWVEFVARLARAGLDV